MVWIKIISTGKVRQADRHEAHALIDKRLAKLTTSPKYKKAITKPRTRDMRPEKRKGYKTKSWQ